VRGRNHGKDRGIKRGRKMRKRGKNLGITRGRGKNHEKMQGTTGRDEVIK
jgi:hypothetical protein